MPESFLTSTLSSTLLALSQHGGLETSIRPLFNSLQEKIPLNALHLFQIMQQPGGRLSLVILAYVDEYGTERKHLRCDLVDTFTSPVLREKYFSPTSDLPIIHGDLFSDPVTAGASQTLFPEYNSSLSLFLIQMDKTYYFLCALARKPHAFTEKDSLVLAKLQQPCAMFCEKFTTRNLGLLTPTDMTVHHTTSLFSDDPVEMLRACKAMPEVLRFAEKAAQSKAPVLILGETGVGKEVVADAIHALSSRKHGPYIKINCGALAEHLVDSELFGHERGSFTGAFRETQGYFEQAHGGTLLLDEVGDLPLHTQIRLLRVLDRREIQKVGGVIHKGLDIRIIAATNANLPQLLEEGAFRKDLYFRLSTLMVSIPPLRKRREDIPVLIRMLWASKSKDYNLETAPEIPESEMLKLLLYPWPGNVRELNAVLDRTLLDYTTNHVLHFSLQEAPRVFRGVANLEATDQTPKNYPTTPSRHTSLMPLDQMLADHVAEALRRCGKINGPGGAAEMLGIHPSTLRARIKKLGIRSALGEGKPF